jgi:hypothetical protein
LEYLSVQLLEIVSALLLEQRLATMMEHWWAAHLVHSLEIPSAKRTALQWGGP